MICDAPRVFVRFARRRAAQVQPGNWELTVASQMQSRAKPICPLGGANLHARTKVSGRRPC
jgi:hypothetical protein